MASYMNWFSDALIRAFAGRDASNTSIIMVGLEGVGKTSILKCIKQVREVANPLPVLGYAFETQITKLGTFTCWDLGVQGSDRTRPLWKHFLLHAGGIVFVIDSDDTERIDYVEEELGWFLRETPDHVPFLVIANKQDLPRAMSPAEIASRLKLNEVTRSPWNIIATCVTTGDGVDKLVDWMRDLSKRGFAV